MNIIFLDIDNVLNYGYMTKDRTYADTYGFAPELVHNLKHILNSVPDTKIVISSSWRMTDKMDHVSTTKNWRNVLEGMLGCKIARDLILDDIPHVNEYPDGFGWTEKRGEDIQLWLDLYSRVYDVKNFAILDDNRSCGSIPNLFPDNFVNVDELEVGECLSRRNADRAIEILLKR